MTVEIKKGRYFARFFYQEGLGFRTVGAIFQDDVGSNEWEVVSHISDQDATEVIEGRLLPSEDNPEADVNEAFLTLFQVLETSALKSGRGHCPVQVVVVDSNDDQVVLQKLLDQPWGCLALGSREDHG